MFLNAAKAQVFAKTLQKLLAHFPKRCVSHVSASAPENENDKVTVSPGPIEFQETWPAAEQASFLRDMVIIEDFLSVAEETDLLKEVDPYMKRLRYEFDHWDDAIQGFRETERQQWYPDNRKIIDRVNRTAFEGSILPHIHILDLAENGVIRPHVDSSRYCGTTIAGLSLLSDSVMRLVRTDETKYKQPKEGCNEDYRSQSSNANIGSYYADVLLKRRSLYIMKDTARYNFTHEILAKDCSTFRQQTVPRGRRVSVICRNKP